MSLSDRVDAYPTRSDTATCENHKTGNGRECEWISDSEYYSVDTLQQNVTVQ